MAAVNAMLVFRSGFVIRFSRHVISEAALNFDLCNMVPSSSGALARLLADFMSRRPLSRVIARGNGSYLGD